MHGSRLLSAACRLAPGLLVLALARPADAQVELGLHADLDCAACHEAAADGTPLEPPRLRAETELLCGSCHQPMALHGVSNHPSGMVPARPLPAEFPLDGQGRMTCATCHEIHGSTAGLLRGAGGWNCGACHDM